MSTEADLREQVVAAANRLVALRLNVGAAGNVSVRLDAQRILITPSGIPPEKMSAASIATLRLDGTVEGDQRPSSEWRMHLDILNARPDMAALVHTHAPFCTTLAVHGRDIPPFHYMIAVLGGKDVRCAPYATFGTQELSDAALVALEGRNACLLAHHGMIALGRDLDHGVAMAVELENLAENYWRALQIGSPPLLSDDEMARVVETFRTSYGPNAKQRA